jgi:hypothetical protein
MQDIDNIVIVRRVDGAVGIPIVVLQNLDQRWLEAGEGLGVFIRQAVLSEPQCKAERLTNPGRQVAEVFVAAATPVDRFLVRDLDVTR